MPSEATYILKQNEFNGNTLSNTVAQFFHIFVIVLLLEYKKRATAIDRASPLNSSAFNSFLSPLSDETVMFR